MCAEKLKLHNMTAPLSWDSEPESLIKTCLLSHHQADMMCKGKFVNVNLCNLHLYLRDTTVCSQSKSTHYIKLHVNYDM